MTVFGHGVASGDPGSTSVVLWTRVSGYEGELSWLLARDTACTDVVAHGVAAPHPDDDHAVHVEVHGLEPATTYWYRFATVDGRTSTVGRTRTLPDPDDPAARIRVGVTCCARYGNGWFTAYRVLAEQQPDVVLHLGDYIYEDGEGAVPGRELDPPWELVTLHDYRRRHAQARSDLDLQDLHAIAPMVMLWDDHEFADNAWLHGAANHQLSEGIWRDRVTAARQAWHEWMPFRARRADDPAIDRGEGELDRRLRVGSLVDVVVVDTRMSGRDEPAHTGGAPTLVPSDDRTLLSEAQREWAHRGLTDPHTTWKLLVNQVHIGAMQLIGAPGLTKRSGPVRPLINPDQWDGYPRERELLLAALREHGTGGVVALSGDLHATFVRTVNDHRGPVLTELTTPAVSSPTFGSAVAARTKGLLRPAMLERILRTKNAGIEWVDTRRHGVSVLDITPDAVDITVHHIAEEGTPAQVRRYRVGRDSPVPQRITDMAG